MFVTLNTLLILDKELGETLRPWFEIPMEVPLPEFSYDVINLLTDRAQMDVSNFNFLWTVLTPSHSLPLSGATYQQERSIPPRRVK